MRYILLNPGPVSISDGVRKAAVSHDLCHREPEYFSLQDRVRSALLKVYGCDRDEWTSVLLAGSGTTALEAMLSSLLPRDARLLVIANGVYGERISRIAEIHGVEHHSVGHEWTDPIDFKRVEEALAGDDFTHVAAVHHETTTGRLNDVARLAGLCEQHGAELLLDAVSSFGAEDIPDPEGQQAFKSMLGDQLIVPIGFAGNYGVVGVGKNARSHVEGLLDAVEAGERGTVALSPANFGLSEENNFFLGLSVPKILKWAAA